jgi:hypothetical protein
LYDTSPSAVHRDFLLAGTGKLNACDHHLLSPVLVQEMQREMDAIPPTYCDLRFGCHPGVGTTPTKLPLQVNILMILQTQVQAPLIRGTKKGEEEENDLKAESESSSVPPEEQTNNGHKNNIQDQDTKSLEANETIYTQDINHMIVAVGIDATDIALCDLAPVWPEVEVWAAYFTDIDFGCPMNWPFSPWNPADSTDIRVWVSDAHISLLDMEAGKNSRLICLELTDGKAGFENESNTAAGPAAGGESYHTSNANAHGSSPNNNKAVRGENGAGSCFFRYRYDEHAYQMEIDLRDVSAMRLCDVPVQHCGLRYCGYSTAVYGYSDRAC